MLYLENLDTPSVPFRWYLPLGGPFGRPLPAGPSHGGYSLPMRPMGVLYSWALVVSVSWTATHVVAVLLWWEGE